MVFPTTKYAWADKIKQTLQQPIKEAGAVASIIQGSCYISLLFACPLQYSARLKALILDSLANYIILDYKYNYLISRFKFKISDEINMQAFIKALVVFDSELDKDIIIQKLKDYNKVNIDAFCQFRLRVLQTKWQDLVNLANDNFMYLLNSDTFIELLKFIISNLDYRTKEVNIKVTNNTYKLSDGNNQPINDAMLGQINECSDAYLITSLIALSPKKIKLYYDTSIKNSTINLLFELFSERIEILK